MTPTEQDKELDLFSEEALKIAEALKNKYPNTWKLLYDNRVMPEVIAFITADRKRVALEARLDELAKIEIGGDNIWTVDSGTDTAMLIEERIAELKAQQEKSMTTSKPYSHSGEKGSTR